MLARAHPNTCHHCGAYLSMYRRRCNNRSGGSNYPRFVYGNMVAVEIADDERGLTSSVVRIRLLFDRRSKRFSTFPRPSKVVDYEP